jgi:hypothetical protein
MTDPLKYNHLDPLVAMRVHLIAERRTAAREGNTDGVLRSQGAIDLLDRALEDELKSPH